MASLTVSITDKNTKRTLFGCGRRIVGGGWVVQASTREFSNMLISRYPFRREVSGR